MDQKDPESAFSWAKVAAWFDEDSDGKLNFREFLQFYVEKLQPCIARKARMLDREQRIAEEAEEAAAAAEAAQDDDDDVDDNFGESPAVGPAPEVASP